MRSSSSPTPTTAPTVLSGRPDRGRVQRDGELQPVADLSPAQGAAGAGCRRHGDAAAGRRDRDERRPADLRRPPEPVVLDRLPDPRFGRGRRGRRAGRLVQVVGRRSVTGVRPEGLPRPHRLQSVDGTAAVDPSAARNLCGTVASGADPDRSPTPPRTSPPRNRYRWRCWWCWRRSARLERAVFVLKEVFDFSYAEIAEAVERSEPAVRQAGHRAREHVRARRPRFESDRIKKREATERFFAATTGGDINALMELLAPDVTLWTDGGGKVRQAMRPDPRRGERRQVARGHQQPTVRRRRNQRYDSRSRRHQWRTGHRDARRWPSHRHDHRRSGRRRSHRRPCTMWPTRTSCTPSPMGSSQHLS